MTNPDQPETAGPRTGDGVAPAPRRPASADDVRTVRRWLWVVGAWAVAASVIALVALLEEEQAPPPSPTLGLSTRLGELERELDTRLERLDARIGGAAADADVTRLERRLRRAEADADGAASAVRRAATTLEALEERIDALEERGGGGTTTEPGGETGQEGDEAESP